MDTNITIEEIGTDFGKLLAQHIVQIIALKKQNEDLAAQLNKLLIEYNELNEENERMARITGSVGHK